MKYRYRPSGVCSREMIIELDGNIIKKLTIVGGCAGNTVGVSRLVEGMNVDEAIKRLKSRYLLEEIAKAEDITISDEEAEAEAVHMAEHYGITKDELLMEFGGLEIVKYDMKMRKAMEILKNNN